jgi:hypothetical protein
MADGFYWVRVEAGADWQVAELHDHEWTVTGSAEPVVPAAIGEAVEPPYDGPWPMVSEWGH